MLICLLNSWKKKQYIRNNDEFNGVTFKGRTDSGVMSLKESSIEVCSCCSACFFNVTFKEYY